MSAIVDGKEYRGAISFTNDGVFTMREDGLCERAIPYPYFVGWGLRKAKCECGKKFKNIDLYNQHYRDFHTDGKIYERTPQGYVEVTPTTNRKEL